MRFYGLVFGLSGLAFLERHPKIGQVRRGENRLRTDRQTIQGKDFRRGSEKTGGDTQKAKIIAQPVAIGLTALSVRSLPTLVGLPKNV